MNFQDIQIYLTPLAFIGFFAWKALQARKIKAAMPNLIANGAVIVDVRSPNEFKLGARPGSLNIPLDQIKSRCGELNKSNTLIVCCASGVRSQLAVKILKQNGFANVINAGAWTNTLT